MATQEELAAANLSTLVRWAINLASPAAPEKAYGYAIIPDGTPRELKRIIVDSLEMLGVHGYGLMTPGKTFVSGDLQETNLDKATVIKLSAAEMKMLASKKVQGLAFDALRGPKTAITPENFRQ